MSNLGSMYRRGEGVARNYERAGSWYGKAAPKSNTAKVNLAYLHRYGLGVKKGNTLAFKFYKEGAEAGHAQSIFELGRLYENGRGTNKYEGSGAPLTVGGAKKLCARPIFDRQDVSQG